MAKHISPGLEWDEVCPIATAAYNFLPNEHARESPFFLMFGRDPRIPLTEALRPRLRYLGNEDVILLKGYFGDVSGRCTVNVQKVLEVCICVCVWGKSTHFW